LLTLIKLLALAIFIVFLWRNRYIWREIKEEFSEAMRDAKNGAPSAERAHQAPPLSDEEQDQILRFYRSLARPALLLRPNPDADTLSAAARLGGPVWLAEDEEWPVGRDGKRLEFVAQLDFSKMPGLSGFPEQGIARFFVGTDDLWGADFDRPDQSDVRVLWHDSDQASGRLEPPEEWKPDGVSPFESETARSEGIALIAERIVDFPDFYDWQVQEKLDHHAGRTGQDEIEDHLFRLTETRAMAHRIGGHPTFTQYDFRRRDHHDEFDVVLLGLTSDDWIMWGDVGEAAFYIRRADLERRDFTRVAFYWDCH
jgi:uncharacterized protein YwqG